MSPAGLVDPDEARRTAEEILARPEYREPQPSMLDRALEAVTDFLGRGFAALTGSGARQRRSASSSPRSSWRWRSGSCSGHCARRGPGRPDRRRRRRPGHLGARRPGRVGRRGRPPGRRRRPPGRAALPLPGDGRHPGAGRRPAGRHRTDAGRDRPGARRAAARARPAARLRDRAVRGRLVRRGPRRRRRRARLRLRRRHARGRPTCDRRCGREPPTSPSARCWSPPCWSAPT